MPVLTPTAMPDARQRMEMVIDLQDLLTGGRAHKRISRWLYRRMAVQTDGCNLYPDDLYGQAAVGG